ncbi:MAG: NAD(P)-binding domain-containing protein, partial [Acidaminococcaceae bacterium]
MEKITTMVKKLTFIGGGAMGEAILKGILQAQLLDKEAITVSDPTTSRQEYLRTSYGVQVTGDNVAAVEDAELVILAVKPQMVDAALTA